MMDELLANGAPRLFVLPSEVAEVTVSREAPSRTGDVGLLAPLLFSELHKCRDMAPVRLPKSMDLFSPDKRSPPLMLKSSAMSISANSLGISPPVSFTDDRYSSRHSSNSSALTSIYRA